MEESAPSALFDREAWFDPIESGIRAQIRALIEELVEQEAASALGRARYSGAARPATCTGTGYGV